MIFLVLSPMSNLLRESLSAGSFSKVSGVLFVRMITSMSPRRLLDSGSLQEAGYSKRLVSCKPTRA